MRKLASLCWTRFRASKDQSPTLSIPQKRSKRFRLCFLGNTVTQLRSTVYQKKWLRKSPILPSRPGRRYPHIAPCILGLMTVCCNFCRTSPCCPSHIHKVPIVPFHRVEAQTVHLPDPQWLSSQHTWHYDTLGLFGHSSQLITDIRDSSPCKALTEEHVKSRPVVLPPSIRFCSAASPHPISADRSSAGKLKIRMACPLSFLTC